METILLKSFVYAHILTRMDDKVFSPEVIVENPFPNEVVQSVLSPTPANPAGTYTPTTNKEKGFPKKRMATELLSTALNTRSRKVLQQFELTQSGGFQVGDFKEGISGDLRITPNGLTARNIAGLTTFAIDGETGDATFLGTLQAGTLIAGDSNVIIDVGGSGGGRILLYNDGMPQILIGDST